MSIYSDLQKITKSLLTDFKQGDLAYVELSAQTGGTPDDPLPPTEIIHPFDGVVRGVQYRYVDNSQIFASDLQTMMPAGDTIPNLEGFILVDSVRHKIVSVSAVPPAGETVVYRIVLRR